MSHSKLALSMDFIFTIRFRSSPLHIRSLSDTFASPRSGVSQDTWPSINIVPSLPLFDRCVSDVSPAHSKAFLGSVLEADLVIPVSSDANESLINDGDRELDQWWNKLLKYGEALLSSVKQDDSPKYGVSKLDQWCDKLLNYSVKHDDSPKAEIESHEEEDQQKECKEGVKVDRVGEAFVVEIICPCGRNYPTLFSGRDCYYKLL